MLSPGGDSKFKSKPELIAQEAQIRKQVWVVILEAFGSLRHANFAHLAVV